MPVQIGAEVHSFSDPTGLLSDCHRRIEMFLGSLEAVANVVDRPLTDETARALTGALQYFREAAPKHNADEEESLFPRLRRMEHPDMKTALAQLERLESDHRWAVPLHQEVERLGHLYLAEGTLSSADVERFRSDVGQLSSMYRQHISVEDDLVLPAAAKLLSEGDRASIAKEMAARRKAPLISLGVKSYLAIVLGMFAVVAVATRPALAQEVTKENVEGVTNFSRVETTVACAGATKPNAVAQLKKMGFASIINLREAGEAGADVDAEAAAAKEAGIRYYWIPFNREMPDPAVVDKFLDAITAPGSEPAFIHCASGNRASAMWMIKRLVVDHWDVDRASKEATDLGLVTPALKQFVIDYAQTHKR